MTTTKKILTVFMSPYRHIRLFFLCALFLTYGTVLYAEELQLNEQQIKSAIVYNIARYVTWPTASLNTGAVFTIGILSQGHPVPAWNSLHGKTIHGHKISVRRFTDLDELTNCQLVFIESSERKNLSRILMSLKEYSILTISDIDGFSHNGGMIALQIINNRMTFEINLKSARAAGLTVSSNILKLASEVIQ